MSALTDSARCSTPSTEFDEAREAQSRTLAPQLFAIYPYYARQAEEEIMFLADVA